MTKYKRKFKKNTKRRIANNLKYIDSSRIGIAKLMIKYNIFHIDNINKFHIRKPTRHYLLNTTIQYNKCERKINEL